MRVVVVYISPPAKYLVCHFWCERPASCKGSLTTHTHTHTRSQPGGSGAGGGGVEGNRPDIQTFWQSITVSEGHI